MKHEYISDLGNFDIHTEELNMYYSLIPHGFGFSMLISLKNHRLSLLGSKTLKQN